MNRSPAYKYSASPILANLQSPLAITQHVVSELLSAVRASQEELVDIDLVILVDDVGLEKLREFPDVKLNQEPTEDGIVGMFLGYCEIVHEPGLSGQENDDNRIVRYPLEVHKWRRI